MSVTAGDAKRRAVVVAPDGRAGLLVYAPPSGPVPGFGSVPEHGRGHSGRQKGKAVVLAAGKRYRYDPATLRVVEQEDR